jgi:hypothetical protein
MSPKKEEMPGYPGVIEVVYFRACIGNAGAERRGRRGATAGLGGPAERWHDSPAEAAN